MGDLGNTYSIDPGTVRKELSQILSSDKFRNAQVLSMFLQFVIEETLAGRINEIKEYTIGIRALGRPPDFNPQVDAVVRIHAGRLRRMLHEYYEGEGSTDPVLIEMPKGGYVPLFKHRNGNGTDDRLLNHISNDIPLIQRKATIAVFPLRNLSIDNSKDFFVEGMGEQICVDLAKFQHLSISPCYPSLKFLAQKEVPENHKEDDFDYMLTGSVRFAENRVQVNVELMIADTGALLWTHTYQRHFNAGMLYTIQDQIIEHLANKLADTDGIVTKNIIQNSSLRKKKVLGVYESVYLYYSFREKYDSDTLEQARLSLENALAIDPDNALIWASLSKVYLHNYCIRFESSAADLEKGKMYAERSMWLDQNCQYAHKAMAWTHFLTGKKQDCREAIERCLDINPIAPSVTGSMGFLMICLGNYLHGFQLLLKTMYLNPITTWYCNLGFALYYYHSGNYQETLNWAQRHPQGDIPLMLLVRLSAKGKLRQENVKVEMEELHESDHRTIKRAPQILNQFVYDNELRIKLLIGLSHD